MYIFYSDRTNFSIIICFDMAQKFKCDSIPYEVQIVNVKEVPRPRNFFDYISYICCGLMIGLLVLT